MRFAIFNINIFMPFSNYQFRFSLLGTILGLLGILMFSSLGTWQVFRAMEKQKLQNDMDIKIKQDVVILEKNDPSITDKKFIKVKALGRYNQKEEILIDNMIHNGKAGYHVLTPFVLSMDQSVILVNRGWVPVGNDRNILPDLKAPQGLIHINGVISAPRSKPPLLLGELDTSTKVWLYFDINKFETKFNIKLLPMIILLNSDDKYGYVRQWPKYEEKVSMHIGYAIQWYVFAVIVLVTYIGVNFKKRNNDDRQCNDE